MMFHRWQNQLITQNKATLPSLISLSVPCDQTADRRRAKGGLGNGKYPALLLLVLSTPVGNNAKIIHGEEIIMER